MGCNASMVDKQGITSGKSDNELAVKYFSSSEDNRVDDTAKRNEEKIELIFKSKRENVYTAGVSLDNRINYHPKNIKKSSGQSKLIRDALDQNFVFASLDNIEKQMLANAMEQISVSEGEDLIQQGEKGDFYYIIETGAFGVIVDGVLVATLEVGRSFGELALIYNTPRAATIRANVPCIVYALDRGTFRNTLANSSFNKAIMITEALSKVPLLQGLTEAQLSKISDSVEILPFPAGDEIIIKGTVGNVFYLIKEGTVRITDVGDGKSFPDHNLGPGLYFGERALLTGEPRAANITALTNVVLMALDRESFTSLLGPLKEVLNTNMILRVLNNLKWFENLSSNTKLKIAKAFDIEAYKAGDVLCHEKSKCEKFFIINDGFAIVMKDAVQIGVQIAGTFFGELHLVEDLARTISVHTVTAHSDMEIFTITRVVFEEIIGSRKQEHIQRVYLDFMGAKRGGSDSNVRQESNFVITDLRNIALLGSGTFGRVSLVQETHTKRIFALKTMLKTEIVAHKQQKNVLNEKNVMMTCNHPFILKLYQTFKDIRKLYMLLEFVQGGELFAVIHTSKADGVPDIQAKFYASGIILAIGYLHKKDIAYRDLKPENCVIDKDGYPKIIDFGFAKKLPGGVKTFTLCGTPEYLAPELVLGRGHNKAVDYWAFGILIYEMLAGFSPFSDAQGMDQVVTCRNIVNGRLSFPRTFGADCKDLVKKLLVREIQNRLGNQRGGADDVIKHPWFARVDFTSYIDKQIKAPWIPKVKNLTDLSYFDVHGIEAHADDGPIDYGVWDKSF